MLKKSALIIAMSLAAGSAFAHAIPAPTSGDPFTIVEQPLVGSNNSYSALNMLTNFNTFAGTMFDVTTPGSLDVFTDDHNDPGSYEASDLYIFKLDADGQDWTIVKYTPEAPRVAPGTNTTHNVYGVPISLWAVTNAGQDSGDSDPGLTEDFSVGTYLALYVSAFSIINVPDQNPYTAIANSAKISTGFFAQDILLAGTGLVDFYVRTAPGSSAIVTPAVEAPAQVPVPGAIWLMGSVLAGFGAFGRKKAIAA